MMRRVLGGVLAAHYLAAFTALGMPVFLPRVLAQLAPHAPDWLAGTLYVLPTVCTALTATWWGRIADRYGRKLSLMRAQIGLAVGFLLAGCAPNLPLFVLGLIVQGACGGSLAAANAYLASQTRGPQLARALDWTQFSARLAMLTAPVALGLTIAHGSAQQLYAWLALLPLAGLAVSATLPSDGVTPPTHAHPVVSTGIGADAALRMLLAVQFLYYFAVVVGFPYFVLYARALGAPSDGVAGLLYSLPHLVYLLLLPWRRAWSAAPQRRLLAGLLVLAGSSAWLAMASHAAALWPLRVVYGIGMTLAISGLNAAFGEAAAQRPAGRLFGLFDACGKWAGAAAGIAAGALVHRLGLAAPFVAGALASALALTLAALAFRLETRGTVYVPARDA